MTQPVPRRVSARSKRLLILAFVAGLGALLGWFVSPQPWIDGWLYDRAVAVRAFTAPNTTPPEVVVIGMDQRSLDDPALAELPRALFGPIWAELIPALKEAGAEVIFFDLLFIYSGNVLKPNYDRDFLRALNAHRDSIVIGRGTAAVPVRKYQAALGFRPESIGLVKLYPDTDNVVRSLPLSDGNGESRLATAQGAILGRLGQSAPDPIYLAPRLHPQALPTYSLIDMLNCARAKGMGQSFKGKTVLIGTVLPAEDRHVSSAQHVPYKPLGTAERICGAAQIWPAGPGAKAIPGIHIHASAINQVLTGQNILAAPRWLRALVTMVAGLLSAAAVFALRPWIAVFAILLAGLGFLALQLGALHLGMWLATGSALVMLMVGYAIVFGLRFLEEETRRRHIQTSFGRYLAPELVKALAQSETGPVPGGTRVDISIMFADLSGFTALSSKVSAEELVQVTNRYLDLLAEAVDRSGGYVDKFLGDAVMAIWGAPVPNQNHAVDAVACALDIAERINTLAQQAERDGQPGFQIKIAVNSGPAIVGNVGSDRRLSYTAMGAAVNVAARLEGLPPNYDLPLVIGPETAELVKDRYRVDKLDEVSLKGVDGLVPIYKVTGLMEPNT